MDWSITENKNTQDVARRVARSIANMNQGILEEEDLYQEGLILVASTGHLNRVANEGDWGLLYTRLRTDLMQKFVEKMERSGELQARKYRNVVIEDADTEAPPVVMFDDGTGDYTEDAVKLLLPAVWDESYAYGLPARDDAPDKDMPKSSSNKARSNSHWAYIADIKTGWKTTPLTLLERRAILMSYGLGWRHKEIATFEGVARQVITNRLNSAVRKITARLNGAGLITEEED